MLAIDTNLIVRYTTGDDAEQAGRAKRLVDDNETFVSTTVLLETGWVLRSTYRFNRAEIAKALRRFSGLPRVTLEEPSRVAQALDWLEQGMDFADAMHLAGSGDCEAFITFDRRLIQAAGRLSKVAVRAP
jgi:predicted nucleic-acid-binding protein